MAARTADWIALVLSSGNYFYFGEIFLGATFAFERGLLPCATRLAIFGPSTNKCKGLTTMDKTSRKVRAPQKIAVEAEALAALVPAEALVQALGEADEVETGSNAPRSARRTLEQAIGNQVRFYRKRNNLTVSELSASAGVSAGMLSKIENGQISPSLSMLQTISEALNLPVSALFATYEERRDCSYVQAGQGARIQRRGTKVGHQYELLGHSLAGPIVVEPYLITLTEDAAPYTAFQHEGIEFIYMLTGEVLYAHADQSYHLTPGDAILFDSGGSHGPQQLLKLPMTYLSIIIYPRG